MAKPLAGRQVVPCGRASASAMPPCIGLLKPVCSSCSLAGAHYGTSTHDFGFYIALIFKYLWISGHCAATAAPVPMSKPKNNSFFTI